MELGLMTRVWSQICLECNKVGNHTSYDDEIDRMVTYMTKKILEALPLFQFEDEPDEGE